MDFTLNPSLQRDVIMKLKLFIGLVPVAAIIVACQTTPISPLAAEPGIEFTLAPDGAVTITDAGLTIKLISILSDDHCPREVECAASGPVQVSLSAQKDNRTTEDFALQTFTDTEGRSPAIEFEGITDRIVYEGYLIRIVGVLPYPEDLSTSIKEDDYRVSFVVTEK